MSIHSSHIFIFTLIDEHVSVLLRSHDGVYSPLGGNLIDNERPFKAMERHFIDQVGMPLPELQKIKPRGARRPFIPYTEYDNGIRAYATFGLFKHDDDVRLYAGSSCVEWISINALFGSGFPWKDVLMADLWKHVVEKILEVFFVNNVDNTR